MGKTYSRRNQDSERKKIRNPKSTRDYKFLDGNIRKRSCKKYELYE